MRVHLHTTGRRAPRRMAMTLLELMVSVSILTFIVFGLYKIFARVQSAFVSGATQTDVFEGSRTVVDLLSRDLDGMRLAGPYDPASTNGATNFFARMDTTNVVVMTNPGGGGLNTNWFWDLCFVNYQSYWETIGYKVGHHTNPLALPANGIGTLYRFSMTNSEILPGGLAANYLAAFLNFPSVAVTYSYNSFINGNFVARATNLVPYTNFFQKIVDGVIRFDITAYDSKGAQVNSLRPYGDTNNFNLPWFSFNGTNLPSLVELELGVLEPGTIEKVRAFQVNNNAATNFLRAQAARVFVFRRQVPIRPARP
jgi:hypothetical protein